MDIEALRKINALTGALRSHGAATSEEALKQAEHILQPLHTNPLETNPLHQQQETGGNAALLERKYQLLLEMNSKKFEQTITTLQDQISQLSTEVSRLRKEFTAATPPAQTTQQPASHHTQTPAEQPVQKKESHPRQGNFGPGDVSIEKMFYFGKK